MSRRRKLALLATAALVGLLGLVALAALFVGSESRLEAAASEALDMEVNIGRAGIDFFPSLHITLEDVLVRSRGVDLLAAERVDFEIVPLPLLALDVRFESIAVERYRISIERDVNGRFNYEPEDPEKVRRALGIESVSLSHGALHYAGDQSGRGFEFTECDLEVSHLSHPGGKSSEIPRKLSMTMEFACAEMQRGSLVLSELQGSLHGKEGIFEFEPITLSVFGGRGSGSLQVDRSGPVPRVHARYSVQELQIEEFLKLLSPEVVAHGPMELTMDLTMQGATAPELTETAQGDVSLVGRNLTLDNRDLDKELARFESSQHFNLVDVGALFLAGPLGVAATKGYDFASLFRGSGGSTRVPLLVSKWDVERGVAHARDVALATSESRLALQGDLDFVHEEFDDVTVALVDPGGCPQVRQRLLGPFAKPVLEKPSFLKSIAGPGIKLVKQFRKLFPGKKCEVFYEGSVAPPAQPSR